MSIDDLIDDREQWAEDHGYYHWKCRDCGASGWTDTSPDCACVDERDLRDPDEEGLDQLIQFG